MSLEAVKSGFLSYLAEKLGEDAGSIAKESSLSSASIFMYSNEFKEYLVEEYNADASIFSKSVNEIMNMDFENGEIVDNTDEVPNSEKLSQEDMTAFLDSVDDPSSYDYDAYAADELAAFTDGQSDAAAAANIPQPAIQTGFTDGTDFSGESGTEASTEGATETEFTDEGSFSDSTTAGTDNNTNDEAGFTDGGTQNDGAIPTQPEVPAETENTTSTDTTKNDVSATEDATIPTTDKESGTKTESKYSEEITKLLDKAYENKKVIKALDTDGDGKLSAEEKEAFEKFVQGDKDELTKEDLEKALQDIKDGKFSYETKEDIPEVEDTDETNNTSATNGASGTSGSSGASGASGSGGGGGVSGAGGTSSATQAENVDKGMTLEELESEKTKKEGEVSDAQNAVSDVYSGENEAVKGAQKDYDDAKEAYDKAVEEDDKISDELKERRETNLNSITEKESEINELNVSINETEGSISEQNSTIDSDESNLQALKDSLSALDSVSSKDSDKQAEIDAKKAELESAISEAEEQLNSDKDKLEELENKKDEYSEKLSTAEDELKELEQERSEIEKEISKNCSKETKAAMKEFNTAKDNVAKVKEQELSTAKADLSTKQSELDEINKQIDEKKAEQTKKDNSMTSDMQKAVDWARQYDDMSQSQMQEIFSKLGYQFDSGAWCADFVRMALGEGVGDENLPDWYKNVDNKAYCPSIQAAGEGHKVSAEEAETGDIVLYDWDGDGSADHVGLFVDNGDGSSTITAIEGNTSGAGGSSCVEEKARNRSNILGIYSMRS